MPKLAEQQGKEQLDKLNHGEEPGLAWSSFKMISRQQPGPFGAQSVAEIFRVDTAKLPAYTGVSSRTALIVWSGSAGYRSLRPSIPPCVSFGSGLQEALAQADTDAYLALSKSQNKVEIKAGALETKE